jgi:hypothetical protein
VVGTHVPESTAGIGEMTLPSGIPAFVREIINGGLSIESDKKCSFVDILGILKENRFRIMDCDDTEEVSAFVEWVESVEKLGTLE